MGASWQGTEFASKREQFFVCLFLSAESRSIYFGFLQISFIFDPLALGMLVVDSPPLVPPRRQVSPLGSSCAQLPGADAVSLSAVLGSRSAPNYLLA